MRKFFALFIIGAFAYPILSRGVERELDDASLASALSEIEAMPLEVCRGALILNHKFYRATEQLSETERRDYFEKFRQEVVDAGYPAPRPPPRPRSAIDVALLQRCGN